MPQRPDGGHPPAPWPVDAPGASVGQIGGLWCMSAGLSVPRHATFGSQRFYRPATGGWKSWPRPQLGGIVGTPSAGWASGAMWWPLGCIVGCWRKLNMVNQLNHRILVRLISEVPRGPTCTFLGCPQPHPTEAEITTPSRLVAGPVWDLRPARVVCGVSGHRQAPSRHAPEPPELPEKTGNSPLAQNSRCRLIAVMTAALR